MPSWPGAVSFLRSLRAFQSSLKDTGSLSSEIKSLLAGCLRVYISSLSVFAFVLRKSPVKLESLLISSNVFAKILAFSVFVIIFSPVSEIVGLI